jgi:hypothetical protein
MTEWLREQQELYSGMNFYEMLTSIDKDKNTLRGGLMAERTMPEDKKG